MSKVIKVGTAGEIAAVVPYVLGFEPHESLVIMGSSSMGPAPTCRVDIDGAEDPDLLEQVARLYRQHNVSALALFYTDDKQRAAGLFEDHVRKAFPDSHGLTVSQGRVYRIDGGGPLEGEPVAEHCAAVATMVADGRTKEDSRERLAERFTPGDIGPVERVLEEVADDYMAHVAADDRDAFVAREASWVRALVRRYLLEPALLADRDVARLALGMISLQVRDAAWSEMNQGNAVEHIQLWTDVALRVPQALRAPALALAGFAYWLKGDGAMALTACDLVRKIEPDYRLAGLIEEACKQAIDPAHWDGFESVSN